MAAASIVVIGARAAAIGTTRAEVMDVASMGRLRTLVLTADATTTGTDEFTARARSMAVRGRPDFRTERVPAWQNLA